MKKIIVIITGAGAGAGWFGALIGFAILFYLWNGSVAALTNLGLSKGNAYDVLLLSIISLLILLITAIFTSDDSLRRTCLYLCLLIVGGVSVAIFAGFQVGHRNKQQGVRNTNSERTSVQELQTHQQRQQSKTSDKYFSGWVFQKLTNAGYVYLEVISSGKRIWAACPQFDVELGDAVHVPEGMPMQNYEIKSLHRKLDLVYFVNAIKTGSTRCVDLRPEGCFKEQGVR